jgi:hypothetical protein
MIANRKTKTYKSLDDNKCIDLVQRAYIEEGSDGQTARHYYYKLLGYKAVEFTNHKNSSKNAYAFVCRLLVKARESGQLPWSAVIDPGRKRTSFSSWDLQEYANIKMKSLIMLDFWRGQPQQVEIWVEKEAIAELVKNTVANYRVPVCINKGYGSVTVVKDAAERYGNGKGWTLLYIGDFDPSGLDIDRALRDGLKKYGSRPNIVRVTLNRDDTISLIPMAGLSLKRTDSRYQKFVELYGPDQQGYEIDSLPARILRQKILEKLNLYMDIGTFEKVIELEDAVDEQLKKQLGGTLNSIVAELLEKGVPDSSLPIIEQHRYLLPKSEFNEQDYEHGEENDYEDEDDYEDDDENYEDEEDYEE